MTRHGEIKHRAKATSFRPSNRCVLQADRHRAQQARHGIIVPTTSTASLDQTSQEITKRLAASRKWPPERAVAPSRSRRSREIPIAQDDPRAFVLGRLTDAGQEPGRSACAGRRP